MVAKVEKSSIVEVIDEGPPTPEADREEKWTVLVVEDDEKYQAQIKEKLLDFEYGGAGCRVIQCSTLDDDATRLAALGADLMILDLSDEAKEVRDAGIATLVAQQEQGWGPAIVFSSYADSYKEDHEGRFARFVVKGTKSEKGVDELMAAVKATFDEGLPQVKHAIQAHLHETLASVLQNQTDDDFARLCAEGDHGAGARVIARRIAVSFGATAGLVAISADVGGEWDGSADAIVPEEMYVRPPVLDHLTTGSMVTDKQGDIWVVLNAACDLVPGQGTFGASRCKLENLVLVPAILWPAPADEVLIADFVKNNTGEVKVKNRAKKIKTQELPDFDFFLPGAFGEPDRVVKFANMVTKSISEVETMECVQTIDSPFIHTITQRFASWISRVGLPNIPTASAEVALWGAVEDLKNAGDADS